MTKPLERDNVIELLKRLGSDQDEAVLEAARQLHAQITLAGMTWEDLLVPDVAADDGDDAEYQDTDDESPETSPETLAETPAETAAETAKKNADARALIDALLAKTDISADLREELEDHKTAIGEGAFEEADRRYLRALHDRLSKRG